MKKRLKKILLSLLVCLIFLNMNITFAKDDEHIEKNDITFPGQGIVLYYNEYNTDI